MDALKRAAKYTCTSKGGLCPMVVEDFTCPSECRIDTKAWQCWMSYFNGKEQQIEMEQMPMELLYDGMPQLIDW